MCAHTSLYTCNIQYCTDCLMAVVSHQMCVHINCVCSFHEKKQTDKSAWLELATNVYMYPVVQFDIPSSEGGMSSPWLHICNCTVALHDCSCMWTRTCVHIYCLTQLQTEQQQQNVKNVRKDILKLTQYTYINCCYGSVFTCNTFLFIFFGVGGRVALSWWFFDNKCV